MGADDQDPRDDNPDDDPDKAPETPLDEPAPPQVQDPPPEPARKGPYVVRPTPGTNNTEAER